MKKIIHTTSAPAPIGPYSQAILVDNTLYASGQIAIDTNTSELNNEDIPTETNQIMKNISEVLKKADMDFSNIIKSSIFLSDLNNFDQVNEVYANYFESDFPARECIEVSRLPKDVNVEISIIACK